MNREDALARISAIEAEAAELRKLVTAEKKKERQEPIEEEDDE